MRYMALPVSFRWDPEFVAKIDAARGDVSRSLWVRRAVEHQLALRDLLPRVDPVFGAAAFNSSEVLAAERALSESSSSGSLDANPPVSTSALPPVAPAEQPAEPREVETAKREQRKAVKEASSLSRAEMFKRAAQK